MAKKANLGPTAQHFKKVLLYAPGMLGNDAVNFFKDNFKRQGWLGARIEPWRKRRPPDKKGRGRAILIKSGRLRRSIRITSITGAVVRVGTDVPYARAHNEGFRGRVAVAAHSRNKYNKLRVGTGKLTKTGKERTKLVSQLAGTIQVRAHQRSMRLPQRQFMGSSPYLTQQLKRRLQAELLKGLR